MRYKVDGVDPVDNRSIWLGHFEINHYFFLGELVPTINKKRDAGNPIFNTLCKTTSTIF